MVYFQIFGTYNQIWFRQIGVNHILMVDASSEIDDLNSLDPHIITAIHNRYYPDIYRFARFRVNDETVAEDITAEVFMRLLNAVHHGKGPSVNLRGWLLRTTANIINDHFRNIYSRPIQNLEDISENSSDTSLIQDDPAILSDQAEERRSIQLALEKLTEAQKLVITLRFGNRLSIEETAELMGKNANTIKALQFRALITLRRYIGSTRI
jgi:RNA polymerase sigma-70 factor (ECF subfamily)